MLHYAWEEIGLLVSVTILALGVGLHRDAIAQPHHLHYRRIVTVVNDTTVGGRVVTVIATSIIHPTTTAVSTVTKPVIGTVLVVGIVAIVIVASAVVVLIALRRR
jgi:hypothetical protein